MNEFVSLLLLARADAAGLRRGVGLVHDDEHRKGSPPLGWPRGGMAR